MKPGRLIRSNQSDGGTCDACQHPVAEHREKRPDEDGYRPLRFHCASCPCVIEAGDAVV